MTNSATITLGYAGTTLTRKYKFENLTVEQCEGLKAKVLALNASISGGTDDGLSEFFISDDYDASDPNNVIGTFTGIIAAQYEQTNVTEIPV